MASFIYPKAKEYMLTGQINVMADTIKFVLVNTAYVPTNSSTDTNLSQLNGTYWGSGSGQTYDAGITIDNKTNTGGVFDTSDATDTITACNSGGVACRSIVIYKQGAAQASSLLIAWLEGTGLPITPNGSDITVTWDNGANKIFAL